MPLVGSAELFFDGLVPKKPNNLPESVVGGAGLNPPKEAKIFLFSP